MINEKNKQPLSYLLKHKNGKMTSIFLILVYLDDVSILMGKYDCVKQFSEKYHKIALNENEK